MEIHDVALLLDGRKTISKKKRHEEPSVSRTRLKANELNLFARTLAGLLEGGVPILKALEGLESSASSPAFKNMLSDIQENIRRGVGFSEALERSGCVPVFFYQTVYGGEVAGRTPMVLGELSKYMEKEQALKRSIRDALVYPGFILAVSFVTLGVLTCSVIPRLKTVYDGFGTKLPLITTVILGMSKAFLPVSVLLIVGGALLVTSLRKKGTLELLAFKAPYAGDFFQRFIRVRFSRLLSLLLESGIPVLDAMLIVEKTFETPFLRHDITLMKSTLAAGKGFSACLAKVRWMDPVSRMLVLSGEETGRLAASFFQVARDTELELETQINLAVKLLEPTLILLMGLSVGFVVIGTVLPIFDMSSIVR